MPPAMLTVEPCAGRGFGVVDVCGCTVADALRFAEQPITVSIGAAALRPGEGWRAVLARADAALYRARSAGRDRAVIDEEPTVHNRCAPIGLTSSGDAGVRSIVPAGGAVSLAKAPYRNLADLRYGVRRATKKESSVAQ